MFPDFYKHSLQLLALSMLFVLGGCSMPDLARTSSNKEVADLVPASVERDYRKALASLEDGDDAKATERLQRFIDLHPGYANAYVNLAIVYDRQQQTEHALQLLAQAIEMDATNVYALNRLGLIKRRVGEFDAAEAAWRTAIAANPDYPNAWYNLGVLYDLYLRDLPAAVDHYQRYQQLNGTGGDSGATVERWIADLERRISNPAQTAQTTEAM